MAQENEIPKLKKIKVTKEMCQSIKSINFPDEQLEVNITRKWYQNPFLLFLISITVFMMLQMYNTLIEAMNTSLFLTSVYLLIIGLAVLGFLLLSLKEISSFMTFQKQKDCVESDNRQDVYNFLANQVYNTDPVIKESFLQWKRKASSCLLAQDVKKAYSDLILEPYIDKKAVQIISVNGFQAACFVAVSPFAITDMLFVWSSNIKMMNQLAQCYGVSLSAYVRYQIYKEIFKNMLTAGSAELLTDVASYWGIGFLGNLSAKIGQGLTSGFFSAKIGMKVAELCRPVAFTEKNKISTGSVFQLIYKGFKDKNLIQDEAE